MASPLPPPSGGRIFFRWDDCFVTGMARMDEQHRGLIDRINQLAAEFADGFPSGMQYIVTLLHDLADYTKAHFAEEVQQMRQNAIDPRHLDEHLQQHRVFMAFLNESQDKILIRKDKDSANGLLAFLCNWLILHILTIDMAMARQIALIQSGKTAQESYALEEQEHVRDPRRQVMVQTMLSAFGDAMERIRALSKARDHYASLAANLELRVTERTQELEKANAALSSTINELTHARDQLIQQEKMAAIGQLAAGVAHEINNPIGFVNSNLGSLKTYVERLLQMLDISEQILETAPLDAQARTDYQRAQASADLSYLRTDIHELLKESAEGLQRVKKIVEDLKNFSRQASQEWQVVDLNAGLEATLNVVWNEIKFKANVIRELGDLPPVACMPGQINQVVMNLLVNAAQAIPEHGTITIRTRLDGADHVLIEISDDGSGMSEEVRQHIFEPFFTTKPTGKGTGLGLSISWDIIKKHHGELDVTSTLGEGCTFRIRLPLTQADAQHPEIKP